MMTVAPYHLSRLLVAIHTYDDASTAIEWGGALAGALHLPVTLVHVVDETNLQTSLHEAQSVAGDWLALLATHPALNRVPVGTTVLTGRPGEALSMLAEKQRGSIVLFTASGQGATGSTALGADLEQLILALTSPFIVVPTPANPPDRIRRIVVGVDQSPLASTVLQTARRVASSLDVEVIPVEAIEPGSIEPDDFVRAEPVIAGDHIRIRGRASRTLLAAAQARDAAIIAVGSHGAGQSRRGPTGSTSAWLSQHADRPVLIVPEAR